MNTSCSAAQLTQLVTYLSGEFDNREQSLAEPTWYVHLHVWNRPLPPHVFSEGFGFFIEQVSGASGKPPYRQRILQVLITDAGLRGQYHALKDPLKFRGSGSQPELLESLTLEDLVCLPTCCLEITPESNGQRFQGRLPANSLCCITVEGKASYLSLGFDIGPTSVQLNESVEYLVHDRGVDPDTGATTWGPLMGPFRLMKQTTFPTGH